ncbi:MAG: glycosyltransferase [Desulfosporosinus fructosivorans]
MPNLVSVVIPVYNAEKFIQESVLSCLNQTYRDVEVILVNDGSLDDSLNIMKQLAETYGNILLIDLPHSGKVNAINAGIERAKGKYIAIQAADDVAFPYRFEIQVATIEGDKEISLVFGDMEVVDEDLRTINQSFWHSQRIRIPQKNHFEELLTHNFVSGGTILLRAELKSKIFPIPNELEFEDWWIALIASYYGKILGVSKKMIMYRQHASNSNTMINADKASWVNRQKRLFARNSAYYLFFEQFISAEVTNLALRDRYLNFVQGAKLRDTLALDPELRSRTYLLRLYLTQCKRFIGTVEFGKLILYALFGERVFVLKYYVSQRTISRSESIDEI